MKYIIGFLFFMIPSLSLGHEMVPTYPKLGPSHIDGLYKTTMTIFNKRQEVEYYEVGVFTEEWRPIPFVSNYKIHKIPYLTSVSVDLYVRAQDRNNVTYICSTSKLRVEDRTRTAVSSKICSMIKRKGTN
jgi:hypothetical protein